MTDIDLGKVAISLKGAWSAIEAYERLDAVNHKGSSWVAKTPNTNTEPTELSPMWMMMAKKGDKGDEGDKGDAFTYGDFTPEQIEELQRPATEAAEQVNEAVEAAQQAAASAEQSVIKAEEAVQTANATNEAVTKAEEARVLAENQRVSAEDAREQAEAEREATFTTLQGQIEEAVNNANGAVTTAEGVLQTAQQANSLAQGAVESANQATQEANQATANANAATESITILETNIESAETKRVSAENSRVSAEAERESAEASRKQAESGRVTAEQGRVSAESGRVTAESGRVSAEQQRVTEFATLKQDAETATANANEAAEKANEAASGITDRLSETYPNFAAIEASGETNPNKIFIDAEKQTSYIYLNGEYVSVGGGSQGAPAGGYSRALFETAGAVYNEETGFYELNGLTDITEEQMTAIYEDFNFNNDIFNRPLRVKNKKLIRTNIPAGNYNASASADVYLMKQKWYYFASSFENLEAVVVTDDEARELLVADDYIGCNYIFYNCPKLRNVKGILNLTNLSKGPINLIGGNCKLLESIFIKGLHVNWKITDCPLLNKESILYAIRNSTATSPITITLHADAYSMAMADEDIQAALAEKTNVSLASA